MKMVEDLEEVVRLMDAAGKVDISQYADGTSEITGPNSAIESLGAAVKYIRTHHATILDMAKRLEAAEGNATVWRCTRSYPTGDGGCYHSEGFAMTRADMLIYKAKGYRCEILNDDAMQETGR